MFTQVELRSQVLYGTVVGTLQDATGAVIPNATVTATNRETSQSREVTTDALGNYSIANLLPGDYEVRAGATGFRTLTRQNVMVVANQSVRADFRMELGQVTENVVVEAAAVLLQTERGDTQTTISAKPVRELPLNLYRNYQALINLVPGATPASFQNSATDTPAASLSTNINGTPRNMNTTRLDGAVNVNIWLPHHNMYVAPSEAVQEVNVSTTAMDAEQGSAGGAAITVITKTGTNDLHGSAWEYHNNQRLRARNFFQPANVEKPRDTLNIFGGTIGGPIVKNRLFYFFHYEGTRQRTGGFGIFDVPTARARTGDLSGLTTAIYDPSTGNPDGSGRTVFPNNQIPLNQISAAAREILNRLPLPTLPGELQNYPVAATGSFNRNNYDYKVNFNRNDRHQLWGKSSFLKAPVTGVAAFGELVGPAVVQDPGTGDTFVQVHGLGHTWALSPSVLLDQNVGFTRQSQTVLGADYGTNWGTDVFGIPGTNGPDIRQSGMPNFSFGYSSVGQAATWMPMFRKDQSFTQDTNVSWLKRSHEIRFGFNLVRHHLNHWQPEIQNPRGAFTFGSNVTWSVGAPGTPNYANSFAAFLLGQPSDFNKSIQFQEMTGREWQYGFYLRDRWRVARNLTVSLGVRLDIYPLMTRRHTGLELYNPENNTMLLTGRGDVPVNQGVSINNPLVAPRIGIAYSITDKTVVRAGYGLTWDPLPFSRPLRGFFPLTLGFNFLGPNGFQPAGTLNAGIPNLPLPDPNATLLEVPLTADVRSPWGEINRGYIQSWNFTIEREWVARLATSFAYVGTQVTNQLLDRNINVGGPGITAANLPFAQRFGRRTAINMWDGWASSNYHSFQFALNRPFSNGLLLKGAYTYSKAINMADDNGWQGVMWNWEPMIHRNRARAGYDRRHVFQMAAVYELPFGKDRKWARSGLASWIIGGWGLNGMVQAFTGTPFTVGSSVTPNSPGNGQTADLVKPDVDFFRDQVGPGQKYFDTTAFAAPAVNTFGNLGRNVFSGPGRFAIDARLSRIFPITERLRFELMGEAFNLTNTPWFANPNTTQDSPLFGEIRSTVTQSGRGVSDRQFRLGARLQF